MVWQKNRDSSAQKQEWQKSSKQGSLNVRHTDKKCKKKSGAIDRFVLILVDWLRILKNNNNNNVNDASIQSALFKTVRAQKY